MDLTDLVGAGDDRRRQRIGEEVRPRSLAQQIDQLLRSGGVAAGGAAQRFAQCRVDDVGPARQSEELFRTSAFDFFLSIAY